MANSNKAGIQELGDGGSSGTRMGTASTDLIGFLGATPITQLTPGTAAVAVDPTASTSTLIASLQSIAVSAASMANANSSILASFGFTS